MVRSLTKRKKSGEVYARPPDIERSIGAALQQDLATHLRRAAVADRNSPDYLPSECLVHLIRDARRRDDHDAMNSLLPILLLRCERNLRTKVPDDHLPNAAHIRDEVLGELSERIADDGTEGHEDELDYYEVRFNDAFRALRIDVVRRERGQTDRFRQLPSLSDEDSPASDDVPLSSLSVAFSKPPTQESDLLRAELNAQLHAAIDGLPPEERDAVMLCHMLGYDIESNDPNKRTAAKICGVSGRTIRNRLSRAAEKLSRFTEEP